MNDSMRDAMDAVQDKTIKGQLVDILIKRHENHYTKADEIIEFFQPQIDLPQDKLNKIKKITDKENRRPHRLNGDNFIGSIYKNP